jgi:hypothetical protein
VHLSLKGQCIHQKDAHENEFHKIRSRHRQVKCPFVNDLTDFHGGDPHDSFGSRACQPIRDFQAVFHILTAFIGRGHAKLFFHVFKAFFEVLRSQNGRLWQVFWGIFSAL